MAGTAQFHCTWSSSNHLKFTLDLTSAPASLTATATATATATPLCTGSAFADEMLHDMLSRDVAPGSSEFATLLKALHCAIKNRHVHATRLLWAKIDDAYGVDWARGAFAKHNAPYLGDELEQLPIDPELLRFLLCYARVPRLVMAMVVLVQDGTPNVLELPHRASGPYPANGAEKHDVTALTATVVCAITAALQGGTEDDPTDDQRHAPEVDVAWYRVVECLVRGMPRRPSKLVGFCENRRRPPVVGGETNMLYVIMQCSKTHLRWLDLLLAHCTFSGASLNEAIGSALRQGTLDERLVLPAIELIYSRLRKGAKPPYTSEGWKAAERAWIILVKRATPVMHVPVFDVRGGEDVEFLCVRRWESNRDPGFFVDILNAMVKMHAQDPGGRKARVPKLACAALGQAMRNSDNTVIVQALVKLVDELEGVRFMARHVPDFVGRLVMHFPLAFRPFCPSDFADEVRSLNDGETLLEDALRDLIGAGSREGVRCVLTLLKRVPKNWHPGVLVQYVTSGLCLNMSLDERSALSDETLLVHYAEIKRDVEQLLRFGSPWADEDLRAAMNSAVATRSSIAAQVLASPPYNVPMPPEGDAFAERIMAHVLAPGAPAVREAQARFAKNAAL